MAKLDENDECPRCAAEVAKAWRLYGVGRHRHLAPAGPWRSREELIARWGDGPDHEPEEEA